MGIFVFGYFLTLQGNAEEVFGLDLKVNLSAGVEPLEINIIASIKGSIERETNYTFYCNRLDLETRITSEWDAKFDNVAEDSKSFKCIYDFPGSYTLKVVAENGSSAVEANKTIEVFSAFADSSIPLGEDTIAVVGCSYSGEGARAYNGISSENKLVDVGRQDLAGQNLKEWGAGSANAWSTLSTFEPRGGYKAAWFQLCLNDSRMSPTHQEQVKRVLDRLLDDYNLFVSDVYISPVSSYSPSGLCNSLGAHASLVGAQIANWATINLGTRRGPSLGPIYKSQIESDNCHLSGKGEEYIGQQLVDFFDKNISFLLRAEEQPRELIEGREKLQKPIANFIIDGRLKSGEVVQFIDTSKDIDGTIAAWRWDFDDETPRAPRRHIVHTFMNPGFYKVSLAVRDDDTLTGRVNKKIYIRPGKDINFLKRVFNLDRIKYLYLRLTNKIDY